jgi:hypothetical protein
LPHVALWHPASGQDLCDGRAQRLDATSLQALRSTLRSTPLDQLLRRVHDVLPIFGPGYVEKDTLGILWGNEVMAKKRRLNLPMIRRLHAKLSIPVECLVKEYKLKGAAAGRSKHR